MYVLRFFPLFSFVLWLFHVILRKIGAEILFFFKLEQVLLLDTFMSLYPPKWHVDCC